MFVPSADAAAKTQMTAFARALGARIGRDLDDEALHRFSVEEAEAFWAFALEHFDLDVQGDRTPAIVGSRPEDARFFPGLGLSFARNLLRGGDDEVAIVSVLEDGSRAQTTRRELAERVLALASSLAKRGVGPGDRVVASAANTTTSVIACIATLAVGASWSSVAPSLGLDATLDRFEQLRPKVFFAHGAVSAQGIRQDVAPRARSVVHALGSLELVVALDGDTAALGDRAVALEELVAEGAHGPFRALADLPSFPFDHPAYILFSSGTTGRPKCIVHGAGGTLLEHVKEHRLHSDLRPGEKLFFQTAAGWMMWNWLVSALASRVTIVLYEGSVTHPSPDALWQMVAREGVHVFGTSPGYLQFTRDAEIVPRTLDLSRLRAIQSTGSVLADDLFLWVRDQVKAVPVQSISGGTDIVGCFLLGNPNLPVFPGELQSKSLGYDVDAFAPDGKPVSPGEIGELVCKRPFPSRPVGLFGDSTGERFHAAYFADHPGVWTHGDLFEPAPGGGGRIHGRSDGVLNVRGIRIGPAEIYRALAAGVPEVAEAMAVEQAAPSEIGGSRLVLLVVLRDHGRGLDAPLADRIRKELLERCSAAHVPAVILARSDLPTTHSGKRSERAARDAVNKREVVNRGALRNPESLDGLAEAPELATEHTARVGGAAPSHTIAVDDVRAIWRDVLGVAKVEADDAFFQLGGHSLAAVTLLARIEKAFGVRLPMSMLLAKASTPARMTEVLTGAAEANASHIVAIRPEGPRVPIFWLPGGGGLSVLAFREVSMRLGEDQPVYGFEAKLSLENAPTSIPEIARRYVDDLVAAFPAGPYLLFGFSFGSWVAFEMGTELRRRGKDVPLLCVFDSPIPTARSRFERSRILAQRAGYHAKTPPSDIPSYVAGTASVVVRRAREKLGQLGLKVDPRETTERSNDTVFDELDRRNRALAARYVRETPPTFDGRITVILATRTSQAAVSPELDDRLTIGRYATRGAEVHRIVGGHLSMLEPPEVDGLAAVLRGCIARATARAETTP